MIHIAPDTLLLLEKKGIVALILIGTVLVINFALRFVLKMALRKKQNKRSLSWVKVFIEAVDAPLRLYLWIIVAAYFFNWVFEVAFKHDFSYFVQGELIATLGVIVWAVIRFIINLENFYIDQVPKGKNASFNMSGIKAISRLIQVSMLLFAAFIVLAIIDVPLSGLVTFGGVSGIAVAYAGKGILTNFFGGMMVYFNRQFSVGDTISSPDRVIDGVVERIDWRYTTIRTNNKQVLYIPNGIFIDIIVINQTRMSNRRIDQKIGVRYDDVSKIPKIFQGIRDFLMQYSEIDALPGIYVHLTDFGNTSVNFLITVYTFATESEKSALIQDVILLKAFEIVQACEADFSTPTMMLMQNPVVATPQK
ncbi:MAG: mechanosensitive ion channel family protein [Gammaproteobacteria bacterium]|nr:mechanosensitive ion channel family protein [Gammaproteobacteria bacterium]